MGISAIMGIAVSGMQAQTTRLSASANNVANALTPGYDRAVTSFATRPTGGVSASVSPAGDTTFDDTSNVDITQEMLSLTQSELAFRANTAVWETGADMWDVLQAIVRD